MKQYEYKLEYFSTVLEHNVENSEKRINELAKQGWHPHLMTEESSYLYIILRREKEKYKERGKEGRGDDPPLLPSDKS
jgi:G:T-mismatch repair DNA endonuclease (very short patch repair protein)